MAFLSRIAGFYRRPICEEEPTVFSCYKPGSEEDTESHRDDLAFTPEINMGIKNRLRNSKNRNFQAQVRFSTPLPDNVDEIEVTLGVAFKQKNGTTTSLAKKTAISNLSNQDEHQSRTDMGVINKLDMNEEHQDVVPSHENGHERAKPERTNHARYVAKCKAMTQKNTSCTRGGISCDPLQTEGARVGPFLCWQHIAFQLKHHKSIRSMSGSGDRLHLKDWFATYLSDPTKVALLTLITDALSSEDGPGYIYCMEVTDATMPTHHHFKVGRTDNINKRPNEYKRCGPPDPELFKLSQVLLEIHKPKLCKCGVKHQEIFRFEAYPDNNKDPLETIIKPVVNRWISFVRLMYGDAV
ncbi:hypothetical protein FRC02_006630 [Tulasnella sp. 418]|nr:hypothetical protein FRC02_006630 [Tulasnella sp. 418]